MPDLDRIRQEFERALSGAGEARALEDVRIRFLGRSGLLAGQFSQMSALSPEERRKQGIQALPRDLGEAIEVAQDSPFLRKALGDHLYTSFLQNKRIEWEQYCSAVTDFELKTYLPLL